MSADTVSQPRRTIDGAGRAPSDLFSYLGIVVMTVLFGVIVGVGIVGMRQIQSTGEQIVQDRVEKIRLVQAMGVAARERTVLLQRMIMVNDPFERDRLSLDYNIHGSRFANARLALLEKDLSAEEKSILDLQGRTSSIAVPIQNLVIDLIAVDDLDKAKAVLTQQAMPLQDKVLAALSELMEYQTTAAHDSVTRTRLAFERGRLITIAMSAFAAGIAVILVWLVSKAARQRRDYYQQLQAANRAKSSFLAKMSHEIRTPLTAIIGFAELSLDGDQRDEERVDALRTIHSSGKHLLNIINDILDLSKIEADKFNIEKERCSLFRILEDITALAQMQADGKGLTFGVEYTLPLPRHIETDPLRLKQIIINLCGNAIKFTERGFVRVNATYNHANEDLIIEVMDSGIGMTTEETGRLFQEFQQVDAGINRKYGGTGLGLAVSQKLASLLGGRITVTSAKGAGSRFALTLKQAADPDQLIHHLHDIEIDSSDRSPPAGMDAGRLAGCVLLVEDTADIRNLVSTYLRRAGVTVKSVENGAHALEVVARERFDLVLMDIQMPVMDGVTAMRSLRAANYATPVIALTANAMKDEQESYRAAGFSDVLAKPVDRVLLHRMLEKYLRATRDADGPPIPSAIGADDPEVLQLVSAFVERLPEYWEPMTAAASGAWAQVQELAHKLKGLGGSMGYPIVSDIAASILLQLKANNFDEVAQHIQRLGNVVARIRAGSHAAARPTAELDQMMNG